MQSTLVLNASYEPLSIISGRRAVMLLVNEKAVALDNSETLMNSANRSVPVPYVILLKEMVSKKGSAQGAKFSRRGVMVRDNFSCVYCGRHAETIDHVVPRKDGGKSTYENCVAACTPCNRKKGHKSLKAMNWSLKTAPKAPSLYANMLGKARHHDETFQAWSEHIFIWDENLRNMFTAVDA